MEPQPTQTLDALVAWMISEGAVMTEDDRLVALSAYRLLGRGRPVDIAAIAASAGQDRDAVRARLARSCDLVFDDDGRVVAFCGLDLRETSHHFVVEGTTLFTWCAWDPLFLAPLLGAEARVESRCPVTGRPVILTVGPNGVVAVSPPRAVLSFMAEYCPGDSVISRFCQYVHFFVSEDEARPWIADHPGTIMLSMSEAFELGRQMNAHRFGLTP